MLTARISHWLLSILSVASALSTDPASAIQADDPLTCKIYVAADKAVPNRIQRMMEAKRDEAAQICESPRGRQQYDSVTPPVHTRDNVCTFQFRGYSESGTTLVRSARFMAQSGSPCPVQTDKRYIAVAGISEGLFDILARFAADVATSPDAFDSAVSMDIRKYADYDSLRRGILNNDPASRFRLEGMGLSEPSLPGVLRYQLIFKSPIAPIRCILEVDFTSSGLKIFSLGRVQ